MSYIDILKIVPTLQSADLVGRLASKKKKKKKGILGDATDVFVSVPLIQSQSQMIGLL